MEKPSNLANPPLLRRPRAIDGPAVHQLIAACPPLDPNSLYCNLLQCSHFASTCAIAESAGELVGYASGYRLPDQPGTLFIWQIAVASEARGYGLARRLVREILKREVNSGITEIHTTITPDNQASAHTFKRLATELDAPLTSAPHFTRESHFGGDHATEHLWRIGPFCPLEPKTQET